MLQSEIYRPKVGRLYTDGVGNICEVESVSDYHVVVSWRDDRWTPAYWPNRCITREMFDDCFVLLDGSEVA